jgi:hypothetical protein
MKLITDCPNCGKTITIEEECYQGWLFCCSCQCVFLSRESLRENWPSLYRALKRKKQLYGAFLHRD